MPPDTASGLWDSVPPLIASGDASRVCALLAATDQMLHLVPFTI